MYSLSAFDYINYIDSNQAQLLNYKSFHRWKTTHGRIQRGAGRGQGAGPPENHKNIGFVRKTGPDPMKKSQSYQASIQCWAIIGTPAKRHLKGVSLAGRCWPADGLLKVVFGSCLPSSTRKKSVVNVGPPLKKLSGPTFCNLVFFFLFKKQQEDWNNYRLYSVWRINPAGTSSRHAEVCCNVFTIKTGRTHIC